MSTRETTHPWMLFTAEEAGDLRRRLRAGPRSRRHLEYVVGCCEEYLDPEAEHFFDFRARRSAFWHGREGNFIIPARLLTLALGGWLADREEFLRTAADALNTLIGEGVVDALGDYTTWRRNPAHDAGKYYKMLALLYDLLCPVLDEAARRALREHADETLALAEEHWREALRYRDNNRGSRFLVGLSLLGLAFEREGIGRVEIARKHAAEADLRLEMGLRFAVGRDGAPYEGPSYGASHASFLAVAAETLARAGRRDLRGDRRFDRLAEYVVHETIAHQGLVNPLNDCNPNAYPLIVYRAGAFGSAPCLWAWDRYALDPSRPGALIRAGRHPVDFWEAPWYLLWPDDLCPEAAPPEARGWPRARLFADRGVAVFRTGWSHDDLHLTCFSGVNQMTAHRQADQNQVTLHALGESFLVDAGYFVADPASGARRHGGPAEAHNVVLIDGHGPAGIVASKHTSRGGWPMGRILRFAADRRVGRLLADGREAYALPHQPLRVDRHLAALWEEGSPPCVVWLDDVQYDLREHEYTLLLHTAEGNRFEISEGLIRIRGRTNVLDVHLVASGPVRVEERPFGALPGVAISLRGVRGRFALLLHPRRPGEPPARFRAALREDVVRASVTLAGHRRVIAFDTAARP